MEFSMGGRCFPEIRRRRVDLPDPVWCCFANIM